MIIDKSIKRVTVANTDIQRIMHGGGILWQKIDDLTGSPGPKELRGGNLQAGFYGEVPGKDFITGDELARRIGLTVGVSQYSNEPWLKFSYLGKVEFVAKKSFRYAISYNDIAAANAVYGNKMVQINGLKYKVRLMKYKSEGKQDDKSSYRGTINHNSEWNRLMLPIHENAPSNWKYPKNVNSPTENWNINYSSKDFTGYTNDMKGITVWCQDFGSGDDNHICGRLLVPSYPDINSDYRNEEFLGWRPVLELVD